VRTERLAAFYDFENEAKIFPGVHNQFRFAVSSMTGGEEIADVRLAFYTRYIADVPSRRFALAAQEISLLNPNTGTLPIFRTRRDAEVSLACFRRHPVLIRDGDANGNAWGLRFARLFDMANDSGHFRSAEDLEWTGASFEGWEWRRDQDGWLPLYEAKMLSHWNHRFATYSGATEAQLNKGTLPRLVSEQLDNPQVEPYPRYWIAEADVAEATPQSWDRDWFIGWRSIGRASDARTFIASVTPRTAMSGKFNLAFPAAPSMGFALQAVWSSLIFDYIARQKQSGADLPFFLVKQLACPTPATFDIDPGWAGSTLADFLRHRVLELAYTSYRIKAYAADIVDGDPGEPFRWLPERRAQLIAELDAAMLHVYGLAREDAEHVLDSFFVVRKYEERDYGEFRTKRLVLTEYDALARAAETGAPYVSPLDPPPGTGPRHPPRTR
jgi:hypothetical protein